MINDTFTYLRSFPIKWLFSPTILLVVFASGCSTSKKPVEFTNAVGTTPTPAPRLAPGEKPDYKTDVQTADDGLTVRVAFSGILPGPDEVDKILRTEFEKIVKKNPSVDATASARANDSDLTENQFSGDLFYKAATKSILTADEFYETKITTEMTDSYMLVTEDHTASEKGSPETNFLLITLVFPQPPPENVAYDALVREIDRARPRGVNILAYVTAGDKDKRRTSWYQVTGSDGNPIYADYGPITDKISTGLRVLKEYPKGN